MTVLCTITGAPTLATFTGRIKKKDCDQAGRGATEGSRRINDSARYQYYEKRSKSSKHIFEKKNIIKQ